MKKFFALLTALVLVLGIACSASALDLGTRLHLTPEDYPNTDMSKPMEIVFVLIQDMPNDMEMIMEKVNELLKPFNTTLRFECCDWTNWSTLYPLMMTSGEVYDAFWMPPDRGLYTYINQEFIPTLTWDWIETYMPYSAKYTPEDAWAQEFFHGEYAGIPQGTADAGGASTTYGVRDDVMEKYGATLETIDTWQGFRDFLLQVAADTEETGLLACAICDTESLASGYFTAEGGGFWQPAGSVSNFVYKTDLNDKMKIPTVDEICWDKPDDVNLALFKEMNELAKAGVWSQSSLANKQLSYTSFSMGSSAVGIHNSTIYRYMKELETTMGLTSSALVLGKASGEAMVPAENYSQNTFAFHTSSKEAGKMERAAMVLDLCRYDYDLYSTLIYGIEGYHGTISEDGYYTPNNEHVADYGAFTCCLTWNLKNGSIKGAPVHDTHTDEIQNVMSDWYQDIKYSKPTAAFMFDGTGFEAYESALKAVNTEYNQTLAHGHNDDYEALYAEYKEKLDASGLETFTKEYKRQYAEWLSYFD